MFWPFEASLGSHPNLRGESLRTPAVNHCLNVEQLLDTSYRYRTSWCSSTWMRQNTALKVNTRRSIPMWDFSSATIAPIMVNANVKHNPTLTLILILILTTELLVIRKFPEIRKFWKERQYFRGKINAQYALRRRQQGFWLSLMWYLIHLNSLIQAFEFRCQEN